MGGRRWSKRTSTTLPRTATTIPWLSERLASITGSAFLRAPIANCSRSSRRRSSARPHVTGRCSSPLPNGRCHPSELVGDLNDDVVSVCLYVFCAKECLERIQEGARTGHLRRDSPRPKEFPAGVWRFRWPSLRVKGRLLVVAHWFDPYKAHRARGAGEGARTCELLGPGVSSQHRTCQLLGPSWLLWLAVPGESLFETPITSQIANSREPADPPRARRASGIVESADLGHGRSPPSAPPLDLSDPGVPPASWRFSPSRMTPLRPTPAGMATTLGAPLTLPRG